MFNNHVMSDVKTRVDSGEFDDSLWEDFQEDVLVCYSIPGKYFSRPRGLPAVGRDLLMGKTVDEVQELFPLCDQVYLDTLDNASIEDDVERVEQMLQHHDIVDDTEDNATAAAINYNATADSADYRDADDDDSGDDWKGLESLSTAKVTPTPLMIIIMFVCFMLFA